MFIVGGSAERYAHVGYDAFKTIKLSTFKYGVSCEPSDLIVGNGIH